MSKPIRIRIDVTKVDKSALYRSDKTGAVYLDLVAWPIKGESRYGETHSVKQQFPQGDPRQRESQFLGNMIVPEDQLPDYQESVPPSDYRPVSPATEYAQNSSKFGSPRDAMTPAHLQGAGDDDIPF